VRLELEGPGKVTVVELADDYRVDATKNGLCAALRELFGADCIV
jgi:hypothetical protein